MQVINTISHVPKNNNNVPQQRSDQAPPQMLPSLTGSLTSQKWNEEVPHKRCKRRHLLFLLLNNMPKRLIFSDDARRINLFAQPLSVIMLLVSFVLSTFVQNDKVGAQTLYPTKNPITGKMTVKFIRGGVPQEEVVDVDGIWVVLFPQWNGRSTVNGKRRITNMDTSVTFPCGVSGITANEVNAYWDTYYNGAIRIGNPTWNCNCHGHSTGLGYWVQFTGYQEVTRFDWVMCLDMDEVSAGCSHYCGNDHSVKITSVRPADSLYPYRVVVETTEKMAYAGTYRSTYLLPGGTSIDHFMTYKPL